MKRQKGANGGPKSPAWRVMTGSSTAGFAQSIRQVSVPAAMGSRRQAGKRAEIPLCGQKHEGCFFANGM
ncbi:MAG: hypothetical protein KH129_14225 [Bacteroides uniformis]|nr:hypothetical protein [Bacteroides uniformis]